MLIPTQILNHHESQALVKSMGVIVQHEDHVT